MEYQLIYVQIVVEWVLDCKLKMVNAENVGICCLAQLNLTDFSNSNAYHPNH